MYDKKLEIVLAAKDVTGKAFATLKGRIDRVTKQVFSLRGAFVAASAAAGMGYFIKKSLDAADAIGKTADRIGIATSALQEYRYAAELSGVSQARLDTGLEAFAKRLGEARAGTGALATLLGKLDKSLLENVKSAVSTEDALKIVFEAMDNMTGASDRAALSAAAFSRTAGVQMVNLLRQGTAGLHDMLQEARDLGLVIDESLIRESEKANDALTKVNLIIKTQLTSAIVELAPTITEVGDRMANWVKANRDLIDQRVQDTINSIRISIEGIYKIYRELPEGVIGASGAGIIGKIIFGGTAGKTLFALVLLNTYMSKLDMGFGNIIDKFKDLQKILFDWENFVADAKSGGPFFEGKIPSRDRLKLTISGPGKLITAEADMWAQGWAKAEQKVAKTWQQSTYGFNQAQQQIRVDAEKTVSEYEEIYDNFLSNVQANFGDTFYDIFQGQLDSFDDFLDSMKDMFIRMLAEMAAAAAMKKIVIPMAADVGGALGLGGLFGSTDDAAKTGGLLGGLGSFIGAAGIGLTIGSLIGNMFKKKDRVPRYKSDQDWMALAQYNQGQGFTSPTQISHHGKGSGITDAVRAVYEQIVEQANITLHTIPMKFQEQIEPYLANVIFKPTDYNFKFDKAEKLIQQMAEKWTGQMENAFNQAAQNLGYTSLAEMMAFEDISWQAKIMAGEVSELEQQMHSINEQFDAWIQQLTQLGTTSERLSQIEGYRQTALDNLTTSTANYLRQIEGLQATLLSITTGRDSPLDAVERLALMKQEISAAMAPDMTPEDIGKIQGLWSDYLRIAQEAYQRPSAEYQQVYLETTAALTSLATWLQGMEHYQHGGYVSQTGPAFLHRGEQIIPPGGASSVAVYFQPSIRVDGSRDSLRASREMTDEFERFMRGRGRKIVQEAVKYQ